MQKGAYRDSAAGQHRREESRSTELTCEAGLEAILLSTIADGLGLSFGDDVSRIGARNEAAQHPVAAYYQDGAVGAAADYIVRSADGDPPHRLVDGPPPRARPPAPRDRAVRPAPATAHTPHG